MTREGLHVVSLGRALRRHWLIVLATTLVATGVAALVASGREPTYRASVQLRFTPPGPEFGVLGLAPGGGDPTREAATNVVEVGSRRVAEAAARELGEEDVDALRARITVSSNPNTNVVDIAADGSSPEAARETALVYARTFQDQQRRNEVKRARAARRVLEERYEDLSRRVRRLERGQRLRDQIEQLAVLEEIGTGSPRLLGQPDDAGRIDKPAQLVVLGGLLGLVLGIGLAFLRAASDRRVRDDEQLAAESPIPVLATIPRSRALRGATPFAELPAGDAEAFRRLYARLRFAPDQPRVVVVSSARDGEGKTTVAANLAAAAASSGDAALLIEADLRDPKLSGRLGVTSRPGLVDVLDGAAEFRAPRSEPNGAGGRLDVLESGGASDRAPTLLRSARMEELLAIARRGYGLVVIDTPPVGRVADAVPLLAQADGVLLSTLVGRSDREETVRLGQEIADMGGTVLGIVVNGGERPSGYPQLVGTARNGR